MNKAITRFFIIGGMLLGAAGLFVPFDVPAENSEVLVRFGMQAYGTMMVLFGTLLLAIRGLN